MTYNNDWKPTENNMPDTFHPTPQTPEQVENGLRSAMRQAIKDGVIDATPYLKQMTETDISKVLIEGEYATIMGVKYKRVEEPKSPVEEAYKEWWGQYPELETDSKYDDMRWQGFQAGYEAAQLKDGCPEPPDEPEYYDEVEWDEKDNPKPMDDVVDEMLKEWKENPPEFLKFEMGKTLEALITRWWCDVFTTHDDWDMETAIDDLCDRIHLWLPKSQSASGSQSLVVEDMVEGFNDCLEKIKSKLRNKK